MAIGLKFIGARSTINVRGLDKLQSRSNYFIGNDSSKWHTNVANYSKVEYKNIYDGIDLVYYGNQRQLEYDFVVNPGADPRAIGFEVESSALRPRQDVRIDASGDLLPFRLSISHTALWATKPINK